MKKITIIILLLLKFLILFGETWYYRLEIIKIPVGNNKDELSPFTASEPIKDEVTHFGAYLSSLGTNSWKRLFDSGPIDFAIDEQENIYLIDRKNIIKKYDKQGNYICSTKKEEGLNDIIRFLGCYKDTIYTLGFPLKGNLYKTIIRLYDTNCNLIDIKPLKGKAGIRYIINQNNDFGFYYLSNKQRFRELKLDKDIWTLEKQELGNKFRLIYDFDKNSKAVILPEINKVIYLKDLWPVPFEVGHRFLNSDFDGNLYFEVADKAIKNYTLGVITLKGVAIKTNIEFNCDYDDKNKDGLIYRDPPYPKFYKTKNGNIYKLVLLKDRVELRRWYKIGEVNSDN